MTLLSESDGVSIRLLRIAVRRTRVDQFGQRIETDFPYDTESLR